LNTTKANVENLQPYNYVLENFQFDVERIVIGFRKHRSTFLKHLNKLRSITYYKS